MQFNSEDTPVRPAVQLGYLVFDVRRPDRWMQFCRSMLGLPAPLANSDGSAGWQVDHAAQRLIVQHGLAEYLSPRSGWSARATARWTDSSRGSNWLMSAPPSSAPRAWACR